MSVRAGLSCAFRPGRLPGGSRCSLCSPPSPCSPALNHYAAAFKDIGDLSRAEAAYRDALRLAREVHQPDDEAHALEGLGNCRLWAGDTAGATTCFQEALDILERLGMAADLGRVQGRLKELEI